MPKGEPARCDNEAAVLNYPHEYGNGFDDYPYREVLYMNEIHDCRECFTIYLQKDSHYSPVVCGPSIPFMVRS